MKSSSLKRFTAAMLTIYFAMAAFAFPLSNTRASVADDLRRKIDERNAVISALQREIASYEKDIAKISGEAKSLKSAIRELDATAKKLAANIKITETKIGAAELEIERLSLGISTAEHDISDGLRDIGSLIRKMNESESQSLIETMLTGDSISTALDEAVRMRMVQDGMLDLVENLKSAKLSLEESKRATEGKKKELLALKSELADQRKVVEINTAEKNRILKETENKESLYKKTLEQKMALKNAFEKELFEFESQLKIEIDRSRIPAAGSGVLSWPLDSISITQRFGMTDFAASRPGLYGGNGHNGVDFRATVGTPVKAALSGVVEGSGNTDSVCPGASYGKWVLVRHNNGLSTLYAHLSLIKVTSGTYVKTGDIIGYSGNTGYSTGPHLHFTVYATQGVRIMSRQSAVCRGAYTMPVADLNAYLDPLIYL